MRKVGVCFFFVVESVIVVDSIIVVRYLESSGFVNGILCVFLHFGLIMLLLLSGDILMFGVKHLDKTAHLS